MKEDNNQFKGMKREKMIKIFEITDTTNIYEIDDESDYQELFNFYHNNRENNKINNFINNDIYFPILYTTHKKNIKIRNTQSNYEDILFKSYFNPKISNETYDCNKQKNLIKILNIKREIN